MPSKSSKINPTDADRELAKRATEFGSENGSFGAPVTAKQVARVREHFGRRDVLKALGLKDAQLKGYAHGDLKASELPKESREQIKLATGAIVAQGEKFWARKLAIVAYSLVHEGKKARTRKPRAARKPTTTQVPVTA